MTREFKSAENSTDGSRVDRNMLQSQHVSFYVASSLIRLNLRKRRREVDFLIAEADEHATTRFP